MDEYSEFTSDDFDVKAWINATVASHLQLQEQQTSAAGTATEQKGSNGSVGGAMFSSTATPNSLDAHLSTVATKLQAVSASINAGLEKSMVEIMVSVPRVLTEVQRVEDSIKQLHGELANLSGQLEDIDHGTNAHVETLARLDLVKSNMGDCLHTLTEAASWNALVREVNSRFGQDDLIGVAERLEAMVGSMEVLKDMPEAEDRAATLRELQERLEALLQPKLLEALKKDRAGSLAQYGSMYGQLGKMEVFRKEYCKARAAAAHKRWFASATSPSSSGGSGGVGGVTGSGLAMWLPSFLEYLQGSLMDERKKTTDLFGADKSPAVLCQLVVAAFQPLLGSFQKHLEAAPWPDSVGMLTEVLRFVGQALELARGAGERDLLAVLLSSAAAFRPIQDSFGSLERQYLSLELRPTLSLLQEAEGTGRRVRGGRGAAAFTRRLEEISEVSTKAFGIVQQSAGRCVELTAGYQARDLLKEVSEALASFLKAVRESAKETRGLAQGVLVRAKPESKTAAADEQEASAAEGGTLDSLLEGGEEEDFDWQLLQGPLMLLGAAGRCQRCFAALEEELASTLLKQRSALFGSTPHNLRSSSKSTADGGISSIVASMISGSNIPGTPTAAASANVNSNGSVVGGGDDSGGGEGTMVTLLRTALARVRLEEDRTVRAEIRAGLMSLADPSSALPGDVLPLAARDVRALAQEARSLVFDVCFAPVRDRLDCVLSLKTWVEDTSGDGGAGLSAGGEDGWEYDTVPQAYMTQVGEHLLSLLQNLEPFANSDAFQDAAEAMEGLHVLTEPAWRECGAALSLGEAEVMLLEHLTGAKPPEGGNDDATEEQEQEGGGDGEHEDEGEAAKFCTAWLLCVGSGTIGCLLAKILSLPTVSERGLKHLEADTKYLTNVFHALDLSPPPLLTHLVTAAGLGREEAASRLSQGGVTGYGPAAAILTKVERRLAEARGISF